MLKSSLFYYSNAYMLVKESVSVGNPTAADAATSNNDKNVIFKNCALFTDCISEVNYTPIDDVKEIDLEMSMYKLIEYNDNYSKTSGSLLQYYIDQV